MISNYKREIQNRVKPNTFISLTAKQGILIGQQFVSGNHEVYERAAKGFWKGVMRQLYCKRAWRRKKGFLPNVTVAECSEAGTWHLHSCLRRPAHVTIQQFERIVKDAWYKSAWAKQRVDVQEYGGWAVPYILKTGQDAILVSCCRFDDDAKDASQSG